MKPIRSLVAAPLLLAAMVAHSEVHGEAGDTTSILIETLVQDGVLSADKAEQIRATAERQAREAREKVERAAVEQGKDVIRVPYVPEYIIEKMKDDIRQDVKPQVVEDILIHAGSESWGIPEAMPLWMQKLTVSGDIRLRVQGDIYADNNVPAGQTPFQQQFFDFQEVNENGSRNGAFLNISEDRYRARVRARIALDTEITRRVSAGVRFATGSKGNPVSTNQTLGNDFGSGDLLLDRAFIKYDFIDDEWTNWLTVWGGRMKNPFFKTDLVWDSDVNLDGFAGTYKLDLTDDDNPIYEYNVFYTMGAFALDEVALSKDDKWLFGFQLGAKIKFPSKNKLKVGLAFYNYHHIVGIRNSQAVPNLYDYTAPGFLQKGNSLFDISNDTDNVPFKRFGLVSDYDLLNLTFQYEFPRLYSFDTDELERFTPFNVILTGDYVKNVGYDPDEIRNRIGSQTMIVNSNFTGAGDPDNEQTEGYMLKVSLGAKKPVWRGDWQAFFAYKSLERDAVLDAFTDSDFHLGGTNAEGWIVGGTYAIDDMTDMKIRYLSADEITGPPLGIDVIQLDLSTRF